uniref:ATP synthase F0 subunit 8 n=1 Tax=Margarites vorticiferus TaxID=1172988 RepID=A0A1W5YRX7_9VEST|nr:ATP synthase F0 subunit 8 [Margarites vorticiferus]
MPQLAPVNWLFLFVLFWSVVALSATLIWWSSKSQYMLESATPSPVANNSELKNKPWNWY